ncbi:MAG: UDP-glucose 4-epimerase GalE [Burkholderiales bacterium]|nr:UDP-glucose 4-epimerase GalE [Burkholderiales bacterium]
MANSVLVTGGAGYIGSHGCKALAGAGWTPVTLDDLSAGHRDAVRWGPFVRGDVGDESLVRTVLRQHGIEAVLHFAARASVAESMQFPGKYFRSNVANTLALLNAMQAEGVHRIVFSSSCSVYGAPAESPIDESQHQQPTNPYGESKRFVERMLHWFGEAHGLRFAALRYFNAAGADPDGELGENHDPETHMIPLAIQAALGHRAHFRIFGTDYPTPDGTAIRDYVHVTDLARAHVDALRRLRDGAASMCVNLGTGRGHSVREVLRMVEQVGARAVPTQDAPRRPGDPPELVARGERAREWLQWQPVHSDLRTIVATAWRWQARATTPGQPAVATG